MRELAQPRILPMPFVTENSRISLIVPIMEADLRSSLTLVRDFARHSLEKGDRVFLMLVFLYSPERPEKNNDSDYFKEVKQLALQVSKKHRAGGRPGAALLWYSLQTKGPAPSQLDLVDLVTAKLDNQTILVVGRWGCSSHPSCPQSLHGGEAGLLQQDQDEHDSGSAGGAQTLSLHHPRSSVRCPSCSTTPRWPGPRAPSPSTPARGTLTAWTPVSGGEELVTWCHSQAMCPSTRVTSWRPGRGSPRPG